MLSKLKSFVQLSKNEVDSQSLDSNPLNFSKFQTVIYSILYF